MVDGQPVQPELPIQVSPLRDLLERNPMVTFQRVVMPYFLRVRAENYMDVTQAAINAADPERFEPYLFSRWGEYIVDHVALPSDEFLHIARYPRAFGRAVNTREWDHRRMDPDVDRRMEEARLREIQALEEKLTTTRNFVGIVAAENSKVRLLAKEARTPGYAHQRARTMYDAAVQAHDTIFERILTVVGREKGWNKEQAVLARKALDVRLFFTGKQRVGNYRAMLALADEYGTRREDLFTRRIRASERILGNYAMPSS